MGRAWPRLAGAAGVGFVPLASSVLIEGGRPATFATDDAIRRFFAATSNHHRAAVAAFPLIPAASPFLPFFAGLHDALRRGVPAPRAFRRPRSLPGVGAGGRRRARERTFGQSQAPREHDTRGGVIHANERGWRVR
jgi:hypothetical protein